MADKLNLWSKRQYLTLAEAALLIIGKYPTKELLDNPPKEFDAVYRMLLEHANEAIDFGRNEFSSEIETIYKLQIRWPRPKSTIEYYDGFLESVQIEREVLNNWLKVNNIKASFFENASDTAPPSDDKNYSEREIDSLLKIIQALAENGYKYPNRGSIEEILNDFEKNNNGVSANTLNKYLNLIKTRLS